MLLRNRDLNVQKNVEQKQQQQANRNRKTLETNNKTTTVTKIAATKAVVTKRPTAKPITSGEQKEYVDEPERKRTRACKVATSSLSLSNLHLPNFSQTLYIDTNKKSRNLQKIVVTLPEHLPCHRKESIRQEGDTTTNYEYDIETAKDLTAVADYARDIFIYYKGRERHFAVFDYMKRLQMNSVLRVQLVDFMVTLQETMELNHETLYLGVKLFDLFMDRTTKIIEPKKFQLIGCTAIFVASKYDERYPPLVDDLVYLSEESFTHEDVMSMERELLITVGFDLGAPLSYRFLRRLARISKTDLVTLTLARYILELSLMSLYFCLQSESLMAAACLLLAKRIRSNNHMNTIENDWDVVIQSSCGFTLIEVEPVMWALNQMLKQRHVQFADFNTTYKKYNHEIFFQVAKCMPLDNKLKK